MSTDVADSPRQAPADPPADQPPVPGPVPRGATWRLSLHGVRTVAVLELRQRVRSTRWVIVLAVWTLILGALTTMIRFAVHRAMDPEFGDLERSLDPATAAVEAERAAHSAGQLMFGIIVFLVLGLAGLVAPALTATSVNGDRAAGVLATMQTTLLSAAEIAVGKLLAAWTTALALLVAGIPFILWAYLEGGTPAGRLLVILLLLALMLLVVCAVALGWSAITARPSTSAVLTYLSVAFLGLGLPLLFAISMPLVTTTEQIRVVEPESADIDPDPSSNPGTDPDPNTQPSFTCITRTREMSQAHTERVWWLLAANPFVILADAAPRPVAGDRASDPLGGIRSGVRELRLGPAPTEDWCSGVEYGSGDSTGQSTSGTTPKPADIAAEEAKRVADREALGVVWPFGLAADLALGTGFVLVAIRRLRTPTRKLPRGTRVA